MSGRISIGDVVVCIDARRLPGRPETGLVEGQTYRVDDTSISHEGVAIVSVEGIDLVYTSSKVYWLLASRFKKIRPADEEFVAQIRACRPHVADTPVFA